MSFKMTFTNGVGGCSLHHIWPYIVFVSVVLTAWVSMEEIVDANWAAVHLRHSTWKDPLGLSVMLVDRPCLLKIPVWVFRCTHRENIGVFTSMSNGEDLRVLSTRKGSLQFGAMTGAMVGDRSHAAIWHRHHVVQDSNIVIHSLVLEYMAWDAHGPARAIKVQGSSKGLVRRF